MDWSSIYESSSFFCNLKVVFSQFKTLPSSRLKKFLLGLECVEAATSCYGAVLLLVMTIRFADPILVIFVIFFHNNYSDHDFYDFFFKIFHQTNEVFFVNKFKLIDRIKYFPFNAIFRQVARFLE